MFEKTKNKQTRGQDWPIQKMQKIRNSRANA